MYRPSILIILGTRPEAIKLAPVVHELRQSGLWTVSICATAQHGEIASEALRWFQVSPDLVIQRDRHEISLAELQADLLSRLVRVVEERRPDLVIVQGDTASALAGAQAAYYSGIPVAHVEAGLRTHDTQSPWPEETNRRLIDALSTYHFCPSVRARSNLQAEGYPSASLIVVGNTGVDALLWSLPRLCVPLRRRRGAPRSCLVTSHRRENIGAGLETICGAITRLTYLLPEYRFIVPLHPNPRVRGQIRQLLGTIRNVKLTEPLSYPQTLEALWRCSGILTDSGGLQEDAVTLNRGSLILREHTERPEGAGCGLVVVSGLSTDRIVELATALLYRPESCVNGIRRVYGDGQASHRIAAILARDYGIGERHTNIGEFVANDSLIDLSENQPLANHHVGSALEPIAQ